MSRSGRLKVFSRTWNILNYVVHEPDQWTTRQIAEDLEENIYAMTNVVILLKKKGYVTSGKTIGRAKALVPTKKGIIALNQANA